MIEAIEPMPELLLPARRDEQAGMAALAQMSDQDFDQRLNGLQRSRQRIEMIHRSLMHKGLDFDVIPGTGSKPTLLKAGAEKLAQFYGWVATFHEDTRFGGEGEPPIIVIMRCRLHLADSTGPVIAEGCGAASSWERKYSRMQGQAAYDLLNTILKMATKRAFVDAVLRASATSSLYAQDLDELRPANAPQNAQGARTAPPRQSRAPRTIVTEAPAESPPVPYICGVEGCGVILNEHEIRGSQKHWPGEFYCTQHGWEKRNSEKAAEQAAETEPVDPFVAEAEV